MNVFKKKGELTQFQILAEIAKNEPHLRQKDIAEKLGITVQAVSENLKNLADEGYVETKMGRSKYKITKRGIDKVKMEASDLKRFADEVLDTMSTYKSIWPAIAREDLKSGDKVGMVMDKGTLYASKDDSSAHAEVLSNAAKGEDVALIKLGGTIDLKPGKVTILILPTITQGGSRSINYSKLKKVIKKDFDKVGIMGTVSRAVVDKLNIKPDFEFSTPNAAVAASKRGLNVLVFTVGKMNRSIIRKLDDDGIEYKLYDVVLEDQEN
ncbi:MAG: winged helix-turn-helix transcriptional regulator [Methanobacteriaceae archaeon]|jgi:putative transcriptional regulator|nr:MAG: transcriptional regulator [Methanobacterium sp. BRmetb2]MCC7558280.1 winged helix-turn-helix transcriptional regulator [Methanobacteriaceae archaeon]